MQTPHTPSTTSTDAEPAETAPVVTGPVPSSNGVATPVSSRTTTAVATPGETYRVSGNPFGIGEILPLLVLCFAALDICVVLNVDLIVSVGAFIVATCGLLLVPAVNLKGHLTLDESGVEFVHGKDKVTATWDQVTGLTNTSEGGLCLTMTGATQTNNKITVPGGLSIENGNAVIPLRVFGDRRHGIIYALRSRMSEDAWAVAVSHQHTTRSTRALAIYALTVAVCMAALVSTFISNWH